MQKQDGEIAHRAILARSRRPQEMPANCEFAMDKYEQQPVSDRWHDEEIGSHDLADMVG
jgi:hypothetical protein